MAMLSVSMSSALWSCVRCMEYVGHGKVIRSAFGQLIRENPALSNSWLSMMCTRMFSQELCISVKQVKTFCKPGNDFDSVIHLKKEYSW